MSSKTLRKEKGNSTSQNFSINNVNFIVSILMNNDVSEDIYVDAMDYFIYIGIYRFKWAMIYFIMFTSLYLVIFTSAMSFSFFILVFSTPCEFILVD